MALLETVAIELGSVIAKAILKFWLKDAEFALDASSPLVDILKSKTTDFFALRKGERQFEEIGESVAVSLLPIFEVEGARIDEGGKIAVASAVAETLHKSRIDAKLLAALSFDAQGLIRHLGHVSPDTTKDFSESETELYKRILAESSKSIIAIASGLPSFTVNTFAEVLKRENQLSDIGHRILEELQKLQAAIRQADPEIAAAQFEAQYRRAVARNLGELELLGVDVASSSQRYALSVAYISLSLAQVSRDTRIKKDSIPVDEALSNAKRLFVLGQAGSGKSTLLQWIAVQSASQAFSSNLADWNESVPFLVRLSDLPSYALSTNRDTPLPRPDEFPRLIAPMVAGEMPPLWVHSKLRSGRAIVLVDGVDEVGRKRREQVRRWIVELVGEFPEARVIVSSRPQVIEAGWMSKQAFEETELQPMNSRGIEDFIDRWHDAISLGFRDDERKVIIEELADNLKSIIRLRQPIRKLAANPMLCAMFCALHRARNRKLPDYDLIELYKACVELLLERRDVERRGVDPTDYPPLALRQKQTLLQELAYWMLRNGWSSVSRRAVLKQIAKYLPIMDLDSEIADKVLSFFIERSELLREPVLGKIDFTHVTFQEYFAAHAVVDAGDIGVLVKNADDDQWWNVIVLAAGLASKPTARKLILKIIRRGDEDPKHRHQLHLLAAACLGNTVIKQTDVREDVKKRLADLVPPKTMEEAAALASAGDLAVSHLAYQAEFEEAIAAACARTLVLIGSELALHELANYTLDTRQQVIEELKHQIAASHNEG